MPFYFIGPVTIISLPYGAPRPQQNRQWNGRKLYWAHARIDHRPRGELYCNEASNAVRERQLKRARPNFLGVGFSMLLFRRPACPLSPVLSPQKDNGMPELPQVLRERPREEITLKSFTPCAAKKAADRQDEAKFFCFRRIYRCIGSSVTCGWPLSPRASGGGGDDNAHPHA